MSLLARQKLCDQLVFQRGSQAADLLAIGFTQTQLIALLLGLTGSGYFLELTAVRTDHHDDSNLGRLCHARGYCVDCWPLASATPGDYLSASDPRFGAFLMSCAASPWLYQIGLAGAADTVDNREAAGPTVFSDTGADHIHLGAIG